MLDSGEADALLWVSSFNPACLPPQSGLPSVVLGHPDMQLAEEPEVFIPVATPGVDHGGVMFRTDNVVSLPLAQLRAGQHQTLGAVLTAIEQAL